MRFLAQMGQPNFNPFQWRDGFLKMKAEYEALSKVIMCQWGFVIVMLFVGSLLFARELYRHKDDPVEKEKLIRFWLAVCAGFVLPIVFQLFCMMGFGVNIVNMFSAG